MGRGIGTTSAVGALALVAAAAAPAVAVDLNGLAVQQQAAGARYAATVSPSAEQTGCEVSLTAELLRARPRRAPRVVRRTRSTTDVCATGEAGTTFIPVRARGSVATGGLASGRYVLRLRADAVGVNGVVTDAVSTRTLLRVLIIRPSRVGRGRTLTFVGAGWPGRASVLLAAGPPNTSPGDRIARFRTTARGTFTRRVRISTRATRGTYVGIAILTNGEKSSARFRIV